jgi:NAD dependent epimerase/dehydratase family enzyme
VRNAAFTAALAAALNRPAILPMPAAALKLLLGERAYLLLGGQQVLPERLLAAGFHFAHPEIAEALQASL